MLRSLEGGSWEAQTLFRSEQLPAVTTSFYLNMNRKLWLSVEHGCLLCVTDLTTFPCLPVNVPGSPSGTFFHTGPCQAKPPVPPTETAEVVVHKTLNQPTTPK